jgi:dTDP-4-dehydrorhamnose reductase
LNALVLGANGQLGNELVEMLGVESSVTRDDLWITDADGVEAILAARKPDVVFNCAAYNAVDRAESEPDKAFASNEHGPAVVAAACLRQGSLLVHFSTNFVFSGDLDRPYVETDEPAPLSVYGRSKLMGEKRVLETNPSFLVIRTAALYGGPHSFPSRILERARSGGPLRVVSDQTINPTYARDLAEAAIELARAGASGIVHGVSEGCCGWDEFARAALAELRIDVQVDSITGSDLAAPARRPANGCMETSRFRPLRPWREALRAWASTRNNP